MLRAERSGGRSQYRYERSGRARATTTKRASTRLGAVAACLLLGAQAARGDTVTDTGTATGADAVLDWNAVMQATVSQTPDPFPQGCSATITQVAVFEAVNAIVGDYEPYLGSLTAPPGASPQAAAVAAAHRALTRLHPDQATSLDAHRVASLAAIADGPTPPDFTPAFRPGLGQVDTFAINSGAQFRVDPPPALRSARYTRDYNESRRSASCTAATARPTGPLSRASMRSTTPCRSTSRRRDR